MCQIRLSIINVDNIKVYKDFGQRNDLFVQLKFRTSFQRNRAKQPLKGYESLGVLASTAVSCARARRPTSMAGRMIPLASTIASCAPLSPLKTSLEYI